MPFGVKNSAGVVTAYAAGSPPPVAGKVWFLLDNGVTSGYTLFPSLPSNDPNPSGQDPTRPLVNIRSAQPREVGAFPGTFTLGNNLDQGFAFCSVAGGGSYNIKVDAVNVPLWDLIPEHIQGPQRMAARVQLKLRASAHGNAATFVCSYDVLTNKFAIGNTAVVFAMTSKPGDANSALPMLGYNQVAYAAAQNYTAEFPAVHSNDWVVMRLQTKIRGPSTVGAVFATGYVTNRWRFLYIINSTAGLYPCADDTERCLKVYLATSAFDLDRQPDSVFTEGSDMFTMDISAAGGGYLGAGEGKSDLTVGRDPVESGTEVEAVSAWYRIIDLGALAAVPMNYEFVKIKLIDPGLPYAQMHHIGVVGTSAGWYGWNNVADNYSDDHVDRATLQESADGSLLPISELPGGAASFSFGQSNPLERADPAIIRSMLRGQRERRQLPGWIGGNARPAVIISQYQPEPVSVGQEWTGYMADAMRYGFLTRSPMVHIQGAEHQYGCEMSFMELV